MRLRHPPGRSGRLWLERRLAIARNGAELLDRKRQVLLNQEEKLRRVAAEAERSWMDAAAEAEAWAGRAAVIAGEDKLALAASQQVPAGIEVRLGSLMGVVYPAEASIELGPPVSPAWGGSAAVDQAAAAHRHALAAAARHAAARSAADRITAERLLTARRQRAVDHRWIPALVAAEASLTLALDEAERAEAIRARWRVSIMTKRSDSGG